jgi:hypothetical protein
MYGSNFSLSYNNIAIAEVSQSMERSIEVNNVAKKTSHKFIAANIFHFNNLLKNDNYGIYFLIFFFNCFPNN